MNDWSLGNMNLDQSAHITDGCTESKGEQACLSTHSKSWNEELRVRGSRFFLLVKPSCEHLPQCGPHNAGKMWPHSCAVSRTLGALQGRKLKLTVLSHRDSHRIGVQKESGKRAAWVKGLVGRWMDG